MEIWAVVVAGGAGNRFGMPKQLAMLGDRRVLDHSVEVVRSHCVGVVVVGSDLGTAETLRVHAVAPGGASRSASVRNGLSALPASATHVLVHDAARPLVPAEVVARVVAALTAGAEAVVPVIPVTDTLRSVSGGTVDRDELRAVQTPQGFALPTLAAAHADEAEATDDAGVIERSGVTVVHVEGSTRSMKITFPEDLAMAEALLGLTRAGGES
jgi:2-C-methyl-D-erythritol 4-phosphate cytidylyltransferase